MIFKACLSLDCHVWALWQMNKTHKSTVCGKNKGFTAPQVLGTISACLKMSETFEVFNFRNRVQMHLLAADFRIYETRVSKYITVKTRHSIGMSMTQLKCFFNSHLCSRPPTVTSWSMCTLIQRWSMFIKWGRRRRFFTEGRSSLARYDNCSAQVLPSRKFQEKKKDTS